MPSQITDLNGIKTAIKSILDGCNSATASPIDLSQNMAVRVQKVLTLNVEKIPIQPELFPAVTIFYKGKSIEPITVAVNQLNAKRKGMLDISIVGIVWVDNINTTDYQLTDLADNECENLMENIENCLRSDPTLGGKVIYSNPTNVTYHNFVTQEGAHMRAGIMNLSARAHY